MGDTFADRSLGRGLKLSRRGSTQAQCALQWIFVFGSVGQLCSYRTEAVVDDARRGPQCLAFVAGQARAADIQDKGKGGLCLGAAGPFDQLTLGRREGCRRPLGVLQ